MARGELPRGAAGAAAGSARTTSPRCTASPASSTTSATNCPEVRAERLAVLDVIADELRLLPGGASSAAAGGRPCRPHPSARRACAATTSTSSRPTASTSTWPPTRPSTTCSATAGCRPRRSGASCCTWPDAATPASIADSDAVCAALQVLEHCQDVGEDARARPRLPARRRAARRRCRRRGAAPAPRPRRGCAGSSPTRSTRAARPARGRARRSSRRLHGWARVAVAGYVAGGLATADALEAATYDVLGHDVRPSSRRTAVHAARVWAGRTSGR